MTITLNATHTVTKGVSVTRSPDGLNLLKDAGCAAAIWQRRPLPEFQNWINSLPADALPSTRLILRPHDVKTAILEVCDIQGMEAGPHLQRLIEDIAALTHIFCGVVTAPFVRLRLDRVTTNACRKFHIDAITARLVCTYRGTGTQYGTAAKGKDPSHIFTVPTGAPILLRGTRWPEQPSAGLVHRSPPIEGTGETRLVLVIDPIFDSEEEV